MRALSIDHLDGGGTAHRKIVGRNIYYWLIKNAFPKGYQVLCMNCQWIKRVEKNECQWIKWVKNNEMKAGEKR